MKKMKILTPAIIVTILLAPILIISCTGELPVKISPPPPTQQAEVQCPQGCFCLTPEEAGKLGYQLCQGQKTQCGTDKAGNPLYCFQKQTEAVPCPPECFCLTEEEAARQGYQFCQGQVVQCGTDPSGNPLYCFSKPSATQPITTAQCPPECFCLTKEEAAKSGFVLCQGQVIQCGTDSAGNPLYCFTKQAAPTEIKPVPVAECPTNCFCLTKEEAAKSGFVLCQGQVTQCGKDSAGNPLYCFQKPTTTEVQCPQGCVCMSKDEAARLGYQYCQGQVMQCGKDSAGNPLYCFQKPQ